MSNFNRLTCTNNTCCNETRFCKVKIHDSIRSLTYLMKIKMLHTKTLTWATVHGSHFPDQYGRWIHRMGKGWDQLWEHMVLDCLTASRYVSKMHIQSNSYQSSQDFPLWSQWNIRTSGFCDAAGFCGRHIAKWLKWEPQRPFKQRPHISFGQIIPDKRATIPLLTTGF